jgi:hypothetical protein
MESFWQELLSDVNIDLSVADLDEQSSEKDLFAEHQRKQWKQKPDARCDMSVRRVRITRHSGLFVHSIWEKSIKGRLLYEIKADEQMVEVFAKEVGQLIRDVLGNNLRQGGWALATTPRRRHKEKNFATRVCELLALKLDIPFYEDVAMAMNTDRVHPEFVLNNCPIETNIVMFDDIVTTGRTLEFTCALLTERGKNVVNFVGINNG